MEENASWISLMRLFMERIWVGWHFQLFKFYSFNVNNASFPCLKRSRKHYQIMKKWTDRVFTKLSKEFFLWLTVSLYKDDQCKIWELVKLIQIIEFFYISLENIFCHVEINEESWKIKSILPLSLPVSFSKLSIISSRLKDFYLR